jgi:enoyl-CoA hydratase
MRLRFPGAALGVPVGPARLVSLCGLSVAKYCLLTSKEIDAEQALRWGLIHKVAPSQATEEAALTLASHMATMDPESVSRIKSMLHGWDDVVGRSKSEGEGQVNWQSEGPGLGYRD